MNGEDLGNVCNTMIDARLEHLMQEVKELEQNYGFSHDFASQKDEINKDKKTLVNYKKKEARYNYKEIESIKKSENYFAPRTIIKPEIKAEWVAANKLKPDLKTFYDTQWDRGQRHNINDFIINTGVKIDDKMYTEHMKTYVENFSGSLSSGKGQANKDNRRLDDILTIRMGYSENVLYWVLAENFIREELGVYLQERQFE